MSGERSESYIQRDDFYPTGFYIELQFILLKLSLEEKCRIALLLLGWGQSTHLV